MEVDLRVPLKRVLIINDDDNRPILVSYEKLFEICFNWGRMRSDGHVCSEYEVDDGCFLIKRFFEDKLVIFPKYTNVDTDIKDALHDNALFPCCFATRGGFY